MLGGTVLFRSLLCGGRRQIHWSRRFCSDEWYTVNNFPPNMPYLVLPRIFYLRTHRPAYLLSSSSATEPIISHQLLFLPPPPPPTDYAFPSVRAGMQKLMCRPPTAKQGRYNNNGLPSRCWPLAALPGTHPSSRQPFEVEEADFQLHHYQP